MHFTTKPLDILEHLHYNASCRARFGHISAPPPGVSESERKDRPFGRSFFCGQTPQTPPVRCLSCLPFPVPPAPQASQLAGAYLRPAFPICPQLFANHICAVPGATPTPPTDFPTVYNPKIVNCHPTVRPQRLFFTRYPKKKQGSRPAFLCLRTKPGPHYRGPIYALTQQNLCYFVALATESKNSRQFSPPTNVLVCLLSFTGQQNIGFVSFGLLPPFLCPGRTTVHHTAQFVNSKLLRPCADRQQLAACVHCFPAPCQP